MFIQQQASVEKKGQSASSVERWWRPLLEVVEASLASNEVFETYRSCTCTAWCRVHPVVGLLWVCLGSCDGSFRGCTAALEIIAGNVVHPVKCSKYVEVLPERFCFEVGWHVLLLHRTRIFKRTHAPAGEILRTGGKVSFCAPGTSRRQQNLLCPVTAVTH